MGDTSSFAVVNIRVYNQPLGDTVVVEWPYEPRVHPLQTPTWRGTITDRVTLVAGPFEERREAAEALLRRLNPTRPDYQSPYSGLVDTRDTL